MRGPTVFACVLAILALLTGRADASMVYSLDVISGSAIGTGSQGTVTLTQNGANEIDVTVDLAPGGKLVNSGGPHTPFVFNLASPETATVTILGGSSTAPAGFYVLSGEQAATPYGDFTNGIGYYGQNGGGHGNAGPLYFSVVDASGITYADFVGNLLGYVFAADVLGTGGSTGSVAATLIATTPLPAALPLFFVGILGVAGVGAKRRRKAA